MGRGLSPYFPATTYYASCHFEICIENRTLPYLVTHCVIYIIITMQKMSIPTTLQIPNAKLPPYVTTETKEPFPPEKLFHPSQKSKTMKQKRPVSARVLKPRKPIRPGSAGKKSSRLVSIRDSNDTFISRVKTRKIPMDKERLHEEALALKIEMHTV